jgi:hypothetical protein
MRLLSAMTLDFHEFEGSNIPEYAILSHRWEGGEVTFQDMQDLTLQLRSKTGFAVGKQYEMDMITFGSIPAVSTKPPARNYRKL